MVDVIDRLDLTELERSYRGSGSAPYHPAMLLGLLIYGYATRVFSSRALERASYDSVAFRFIAGNDHPDHDTIAAFRKRFIGHIEPLSCLRHSPRPMQRTVAFASEPPSSGN